MAREIDEATAQFLLTALWDLQAWFGMAGDVERLDLDVPRGGGVRLTAPVRVADQTILLAGAGINVIDAYAALARNAADQVVAGAIVGAAFTQLIDPKPA